MADEKVRVPQEVFDKYQEIRKIVYTGYTDKVQNKDGKMVNDLYVKEPEDTSYQYKDENENMHTVPRYTITIRNHHNEELDYHMPKDRCAYICYGEWKDGECKSVYLDKYDTVENSVKSQSLKELAIELDKVLEKEYERE